MTDSTQYAELRGEMREGFARLDGRLDTLTKAIEASNAQHITASAELRKDVDDHEARLRVLENRRTVTPLGLWTVVAGGVGLAIAAVSLFI